jgi:peptidoglycan/xylan/chitin deacetylase (PgdA/CDA1 family)
MWGLVATLVALLVGLARYHFWRPVKSWELPRVFMYHSVGPGEPTGMNLPPAKFEQQLSFLAKHGYQTCTMSELVARTGPFDRRTVALTFDDGFANNYDEVFPRLKQHQCKATIYLSPEIEGISKLSPAQIAEMAASGLVEFGAHTLTHIALLRTADDIAEAEILGSRRAVEQLTGQPCLTFSYPYGRYTSAHVAMVQGMGFTSAVSVRKAIEPLGNLFEIPRIGIHGRTDLLQFHIALTRGKYRL